MVRVVSSVKIGQVLAENQSFAHPLTAKIGICQNFLTTLQTLSYKNRQSRIEDFFDSNAQARPIIEGRR